HGQEQPASGCDKRSQGWKVHLSGYFEIVKLLRVLMGARINTNHYIVELSNTFFLTFNLAVFVSWLSLLIQFDKSPVGRGICNDLNCVLECFIRFVGLTLFN